MKNKKAISVESQLTIEYTCPIVLYHASMFWQAPISCTGTSHFQESLREIESIRVNDFAWGGRSIAWNEAAKTFCFGKEKVDTLQKNICLFGKWWVWLG